MTARLFMPPYALFPYERTLGELELQALDIEIVRRAEDHVVVRPGSDLAALRRLTYVDRIEVPGHPPMHTDVARLEAVHKEQRGRADGRQATRYHLHGIHEYKGKFNPQVVRAFANVLELQAGEMLIDPFCGSGTALVEGLCMGADVLGVDRSPMAVEISRAKLAALKAPDPAAVATELRTWIDATYRAIEEAQLQDPPREPQLVGLDAPTRRYLSDWFTAPALAALDVALAASTALRHEASGRLARIAISSLCRAVSLQLPEDLRVRRRPDGFVAPLLAPLVFNAVERVAGALDELERTGLMVSGCGDIRWGSADVSAHLAAATEALRRVVITSPPYASALPYIDTDRLSIMLLGLASHRNIKTLERELIGSREWTAKEAERWSAALAANEANLPAVVLNTCRALAYDAPPDAGFRRRAVPALLYRYFANMARSFCALGTVLREQEPAVFIVGVNRSATATGRAVIDTPNLLAAIGEARGFRVREVLKLDTWRRYGLHGANGVESESAVWLERRR